MKDQSPKKRNRTRITDENQLAKAILDCIIEVSEEEAPPVQDKNPRAVERGQRGGVKGGEARAKKLSAKERSAIARKAAKARWSKT